MPHHSPSSLDTLSGDASFLLCFRASFTVLLPRNLIQDADKFLYLLRHGGRVRWRWKSASIQNSQCWVAVLCHVFLQPYEVNRPVPDSQMLWSLSRSWECVGIALAPQSGVSVCLNCDLAKIQPFSWAKETSIVLEQDSIHPQMGRNRSPCSPLWSSMPDSKYTLGCDINSQISVAT